MRMRRVAVLSLMLLLALLTAACGGSANDRAAETPPSPAVPGAAAASAATGAPAAAATPRPRPTNPEIIVSTTTSTVDSGLLEALQPIFERQSGYKLTILSQGSGAALKSGERGESDVVLVHSPDAERQFMSDGHGTRRELVMHNDFIIVGPAADPARIRSSTSALDAMTRIAATGAPFISRGDNSGTHALEMKLWKDAAADPKGQPWYQESGSGMGQSLQIASEKAAYTIADRGTYLNLKRNLSLDVLREGDSSLLNVYHVIQVNPAKSGKVNAEGATTFIAFLISPEGQRLIGEYGNDRFGQPLFVPDYGRDVSKLGS